MEEVEGVREIYKDIPINGSCLDIGGNQGRLRAFLKPKQNYISCDPFINIFDILDTQKNIFKVYPFLKEPVNFICCDAEFLPFKSSCFQTVHMRSVIDHFLNPELALNEAYRVLENNGSLIVGLYVYGGKTGKVNLISHFKKYLREILLLSGMQRFIDHHIWHPTYKELTELISASGFLITKIHWQKKSNNMVCFIKAKKQNGLKRCQN